MTGMLCWWECQWKIGVKHGRASARAAQGLSPARIELRGKFTSRIELRGKFISRIELRVQKRGCPHAHCAISAWLWLWERKKKRFLCEHPLPLIFLQVLGTTLRMLLIQNENKMEFLCLQSLSTEPELLSAGWGCNSWAFPAGARCRNSHFLWQISSGASITKPWLDQMTPWEASEGEKARAGMLQSWNVLSSVKNLHSQGSCERHQLNNLDLTIPNSSAWTLDHSVTVPLQQGLWDCIPQPEMQISVFPEFSGSLLLSILFSFQGRISTD